MRQRLELREQSLLSPHATRSDTSRGRALPESPSDLRTEFQRDRDRIIHTKSFRRLKHKTQVFIAPPGDHYVTRLTHTLEVAQVGRTIARALNLNEDLVEAMALGHDLGHTPFGHAGEQVLNQSYPEGFRHSQQSLRVVEILEKEGAGLNLTWEVRQGIVSHSKPRGDFLATTNDADLTLEAEICRISDAIAYLNHDIGDAIRAGILKEQQLPKAARDILGNRHAQRIDTLVTDIVNTSWSCTGENGPCKDPPHVLMSPKVSSAFMELREFMFQHVYLVVSEEQVCKRAQEIVESLYKHFLTNPEEMPPNYASAGESPERMAVDYISGMTDNFAVQLAETLWPGISEEAFTGRI